MPTVDHHDIDRGWAWVAAVAAYLTMIIKCLTLYMGGLLYIALLETFNDGKAKTSLVSAINSGLLCFLGKFLSNVYCLTKQTLHQKSKLFYSSSYFE